MPRIVLTTDDGKEIELTPQVLRLNPTDKLLVKLNEPTKGDEANNIINTVAKWAGIEDKTRILLTLLDISVLQQQ